MSSSIEAFLAKHPHWPEVRSVMERLEKAGHQAVLAGGCVRDALLKRSFHDFDVATSATPDQVEALFEKTVAVGKAFGVMMVVENGVVFEVATFRKDGSYADGRRPDRIEFADLAEDARRRDFTVNALFYELKTKKVLDLVEGMEDLRGGVIRAVGEAGERFNEDRLRLLRAVRFAAQLGFEIESKTWMGVMTLNSGISQVAKERQMQELRRLAEANECARGWILLEKSHLLNRLLPSLAELAEAHPQVWLVVLASLTRFQISPPIEVQLAWMYFSLEPRQGARMLVDALKDLKATQKELQQALLIFQGLSELVLPKLPLARRLMLVGGAAGPWLVEFWPQAACEMRSEIEETMGRLAEILDEKGNLPAPLVLGADLLKIGMKAGPSFGMILQDAYALQLTEKISRAQLLKWVEMQAKRT